MRAPREADVPFLHLIMADPEVMRFAATPPHPDYETTREWLLGHLGDRGTNEAFTIEEDGEIIGRIAARSTEIGFVIARSHWGRGLASEACRAFLAHRIEMGETVFEARVDPENLPSLSLLEKLGFSVVDLRVRAFRVGHRWADTLILRLEVNDRTLKGLVPDIEAPGAISAMTNDVGS